VQRLVAELNLGLQSVVFIDDSPAERDRVRCALPEVMVPDWPSDPMFFASALADLRSFDAARITEEDLQRTKMYVAERARSEGMTRSASVEQWLKSLEISIEARPLEDADRPRALQLINKTNQMNLTTRRLTEAELAAWLREPGRHMWTFRVSDKFGNYGLTGLVSVAMENSAAQICDFVLSCRVPGSGKRGAGRPRNVSPHREEPRLSRILPTLRACDRQRSSRVRLGLDPGIRAPRRNPLCKTAMTWDGSSPSTRSTRRMSKRSLDFTPACSVTAPSPNSDRFSCDGFIIPGSSRTV
jgi:hypothetical protein